MSGKPLTTVTTAGVGRLARPVMDWPISREGFEELAEQWRGEHVCLSLWARDGKHIATDPAGGRFWTTLWSQGDAFRCGLAEFARGRANEIDAGSHSTERDAPTWGPWWPEIGLLIAPVRWRRRLAGVVVGSVLLTERFGEALTRLCDTCGADREAMEAMASRGGTVPREEVPRLSRFLRRSVQRVREIEVGREEAAILTNNLDTTYEELNLLYQISSRLQLPQKPIRVCARVGRDVLEVSRAASIGFVLSERGLPAVSNGPTEVSPTQELADRVVQVGVGAPSLEDLDCLAESLEIDSPSGARHLLLNDACSRQALGWASGWLKNLAALPLWHEKHLLGVLVAINCEDEGDFTSVDVQLLRAVADRVAAFLENQRLYDGVTDLLMGLLHTLVNSIDAKDPYTCGHSERVAFISRALAHEAGLSPAECERVYIAGLLHDVGKLGVPDAILCKPGKLTVDEFDAMRKHPEIGARILSRVRQIADLLPGVLHHHERMDGRGYPHRLADKGIPLLGRIICLGDCFDAMTTSRTYRAALPLPLALAEIRRCSGTQFDPALAEMFLRLDHGRLLAEARESSAVDPRIGHTGALNVGLGGRDHLVGTGPAPAEVRASR